VTQPSKTQPLKTARPLKTLPLVEQFAYGLDAPICLTRELTYA